MREKKVNMNTLDKLRGKELQILCRGLDIPHSGKKAELIARIHDHLGDLSACKTHNEESSSSSNGESSTSSSFIDVHDHVTVIGRIKRRFIDPLHESIFGSINAGGERRNGRLACLKRLTNILCLLVGVVGGAHSISQIYLFYFGRPIELPRTW